MMMEFVGVVAAVDVFFFGVAAVDTPFFAAAIVIQTL